MWCPNCGSQLPDSFSFCMSCGTDLRPLKAAMTQSGAVSTSDSTTEPAVASFPLCDSAPVPSSDANSEPRHAVATNKAMCRAKSFMAYLEEQGYHHCNYCHNREGDHLDGRVKMNYRSRNYSFAHIGVYVDFGYNNSVETDSVHIWTSAMVSFPPELRHDALEVINRVPIERRFVRYYLNERGDLEADTDVYVGEDSAAERTLDQVDTFVSAIEQTYADFQKVRWN